MVVAVFLKVGTLPRELHRVFKQRNKVRLSRQMNAVIQQELEEISLIELP